LLPTGRFFFAQSIFDFLQQYNVQQLDPARRFLDYRSGILSIFEK